jgi:hypothetical protein
VRRWLFLLATGCHFHTHAIGDGSLDGPADVPADIAPDMMVDAFDPLCFGHTPFEFCLPALPSAPVTFLGDKNFDSTPATATTCDSGDGQILMITGVPACVVAATSITTTDPTGSYGSLPLVLVATDSITINGLLDGRSATGGQPGPGSNPSECGSLTASDGANDTTRVGGGGGAGGSFAIAGGGGGSGAGGIAAAGVPIAVQPGTVLRGGCNGGTGGTGSSSYPIAGGPGGGAIYLVARNTITLTGTLTASGGGGTGGDSLAGGGGGGAGGMIILDAPMLSIGASAAILANGGGGGAGGGTTANGGNGGDAVAVASPAVGGTADLSAGHGGNGGYGTTAAAAGAMGTSGGGGGGGGVGVIHVFSTQTIPAAQVSPPPS